jgi:hypothetical protein
MKCAGYFFRSVELLKWWRIFPPLWPAVSWLCLQNPAIASHPKRGSHSPLLIYIRFPLISSSHLLLCLQSSLPTYIISNNPSKTDFGCVFRIKLYWTSVQCRTGNLRLAKEWKRYKEEGKVSRWSEVSQCLFERIAVRWETRVPDYMDQCWSWKRHVSCA